MYQPRSEKVNKTEIPDFNSLGWEIYLGDSIVQLLACTYMVLDLVF